MMPNLCDAIWYKSSRSGGNGGNCVEVAELTDIVAVRDSKRPDSGVLIFDHARWTGFVEATKNGEFDR